MAEIYASLDRCNRLGTVGSITRLHQWSKERDAGRMRLDRVEGGDSRRTGPGRTTSQDVPLEGQSVVSALGYTPVSFTIAPVHALPIKGFERDCQAQDPVTWLLCR